MWKRGEWSILSKTMESAAGKMNMLTLNLTKHRSRCVNSLYMGKKNTTASQQPISAWSKLQGLSILFVNSVRTPAPLSPRVIIIL